VRLSEPLRLMPSGRSSALIVTTYCPGRDVDRPLAVGVGLGGADLLAVGGRNGHLDAVDGTALAGLERADDRLALGVCHARAEGCQPEPEARDEQQPDHQRDSLLRATGSPP